MSGFNKAGILSWLAPPYIVIHSFRCDRVKQRGRTQEKERQLNAYYLRDRQVGTQYAKQIVKRWELEVLRPRWTRCSLSQAFQRMRFTPKRRSAEPPFSICTWDVMSHVDEVNNRYSERRALRPIPRAPFAFKDLMIHWILQFALHIAFRCVLHRCENQDIHC